MCKLILAALLAITATKEYVDRRDRETTTNLTARIEAATNALDTAVSGRGYLTEHQSLTNYYTKGEVDTAVANATPDDYATVSNRAMTAVQTETDPTVSSWAKSSTKPTYTLNEVAPDTENWLGVPGTTAGGKSIKVLAKTVNGVIEGGVTVTASSNNDNNTTKYRYGGVSVTRNGTNTDYLWDTTSSSGIVRRAELAPFLTSETDPTVPAWAKAETKPAYTAAEVGAIANTGDQTLNGTLSVTGLTVGKYYPVFSAMEDFDGAYAMICGKWSFENSFGSRISCQDGMDIEYVAFLSDIDLATNALDTAISGRGYLTEHQSLTNIYTKAEVDAAIANATPEGTNTVNTIPYWQAPVYCTVEDEATLSVSGTWPEGMPVFVRADTYGDYTPASNLTLVGYNAWPAGGSAFQACIWRLGSAYYCNIIYVEED